MTRIGELRYTPRVIRYLTRSLQLLEWVPVLVVRYRFLTVVRCPPVRLTEFHLKSKTTKKATQTTNSTAASKKARPNSKSAAVIAKVIRNARAAQIAKGKIPPSALNGGNGTAKVIASKTPVVIAPKPITIEIINFKAGDKIVYPGHGVGEVEAIRITTIGGEEHQFYNIKIIETGMKVMVPMTQASTVGLRKICDKKAIDKVYEILRNRNFKIDTQTWNRRFREYSQKIKTGSVYEIAVVLRDLSVLSADKELSFGEKKMLDMAQNLLVSEIAIAKARPQEKIMGELKEIFS